jgi:hypothetical protein
VGAKGAFDPFPKDFSIEYPFIIAVQRWGIMPKNTIPIPIHLRGTTKPKFL